MELLQAIVLGKCIAERWRGSKCDCLADLDQCGPDEVGRMARALSLTPRELRALVSKADPPGHLYRRMADLGLDRNELARAAPEIMRDMQKLCTMCDSKVRCQRDLLECADPSSAWQAYCPNDDTLYGLTLW